jgi:Zn-dependent protease with chaperone function
MKHAFVIAITFGVVAALVVWWLERFEINKFHGEVQSYMKHQNLFQQFLREKGDVGE